MAGYVERIVNWLASTPSQHSSGVFPSPVLKVIESIIGDKNSTTAETGCGKSTILFSNLSQRHLVFALDDRAYNEVSSVNFYQSSPLTRPERIIENFGPSQKTVVEFNHSLESYDVVLLDGAHGWPFPELEYFFFYPHIKHEGYLIVDDVNIPTIGRMADILAEDQMWDLVEIIAGTAIFRRTSFPVFDPHGDGWWTQIFNRRRVSEARDIFLSSSDVKDRISSLHLDDSVHG